MLGLVGSKCGMTRVFNEAGDSIPVTVIEVLPNFVTQVKTPEIDGYTALQVTTGKKKVSRINKPAAGHFAKAKVEAGLGLWEFVIDGDIAHQVGDELNLADVFITGQLVDVQATSKGKGFAGTVKRHNFRTQDATHGNSRSHRVPGSIGQNQTPRRVFKNKKMAGHLGDETKTIQNQEVVSIDVARNIILVKGGVPGPKGGRVILRPAIKVDYNKEKAKG